MRLDHTRSSTAVTTVAATSAIGAGTLPWADVPADHTAAHPMRRRPARVALAVCLVLAMVLVVTAPVSAAARISVSGTATPDGLVILTGRGFSPGTMLQARWDSASTRMRLIWVDARGGFKASIRVPRSARLGTHRISLARVSRSAIARYGGTSSRRLIPARTTLRVSLRVRARSSLGGSVTYGPGIGMDSLNNTHVGGPDNRSTSYRFRATTSSRLESIRVYVIGPSHSGYGAGTGGLWQVTVQTDDGTSKHAPSGTILASASFRPVDDFPVISWSSPASLTAGQLYHVVFRNTDSNPRANYASLDGVFMYRPTNPRQAAFGDVDWGQPVRSGTGAWADSPNTVPIMQLSYANGIIAGLGYMEVWIGSPQDISGDARVREAFTVSGSDRTVRSFSVRLTRISGSGPLTVRLETSAGAVLGSGTIPASQFPVGSRGGSDATWATYTFDAPKTLASGRSYNVVLSSPMTTAYSAFVIREGSYYRFSPTTYFGDGRAQYTTGSGWTNFSRGGGASGEGDLQFYFR